jgi:hypothetical protein
MRRYVRLAVALAAVAWPGPSFAEASPSDLAGTYNGSQMEVGTELHLEPNGHFQYYLSYGALDEMAEGTWAASNEGIVLTTPPIRAPAFELVGTELGKGSTLTLSIDLPEGEMSEQYFEAIVLDSGGNGAETQFTDDGLTLTFPAGKSASAIVLVLPVFDLSSQKFPVPPGTQAMHFRFAPNDLGKVAFDRQLLRREGGAFVLERLGRTLRFRKEPPHSGSDGEERPDTEEK